MLEMRDLGHLRMKYIIEDNKELQDQTKEVVKRDLVAQWLVGDELKQDQFKFFYDTVKIIYDTALKDKLLADDETIVTEVIPQLIAYKSVMVIRDIQLRKAFEAKKAKEKAERERKEFEAEEARIAAKKAAKEAKIKAEMEALEK